MSEAPATGSEVASSGDTDEKKPRTAKELALALWFPAFFVLGFMLFYLLPFHAPSPNGIAVDVVGAGPAQQVSAQLERAVPGGFEVSPVADAGAIRDSIFERDAVAGYDPGAHTLYIAKADGMQLSQVLQGVFGPLSGGQPLQVVDLAPTAPGDGFGTALFYIAMAWNISGYIAVMMMMQALTLSRRTKLLALMGFGAAATVVCWLFGIAIQAIPPHPAVLVVGFLLSQAVAWTTFGLAPFVKRALPGVAMGLFVLLSIPSSGGAIPKEMVPTMFQVLHHVMPLGQAIDAARSILYFDGAAVALPLLGLVAWWALGAGLVALGVWKERRDASASEDGDSDDGDPADEDGLDRRIVEAVADEASVGGAHQDSLADARLLTHPLPTLIGRVAGASGDPVPRATVTVVDGAGRQLDAARTSSDGRFAVRGEGEGWMTVLVAAPGHGPVSQRLRLTGPVAHRSFRLDADAAADADADGYGSERARRRSASLNPAWSPRAEAEV